jgi:methylmalonyl-CoA/ethylmalonyl-CoA epimerase
MKKEAEAAKSDFGLKPHHCAMSVPDIERSIAWYREMLGFSLEKRGTLPAIGAEVAFLLKGEFRIELFEVPGAEVLPASRRVPNQDLRTHGTKHIAFAVEDILATIDVLRRKGVAIAMEPTNIEGTRVAFINDNNGNLIEFVETAFDAS